MQAWHFRVIGALMIGLTLHGLIFYVVLDEMNLALSIANFVSFMLIVTGASLVGVGGDMKMGKNDEDSAP